MSGAAPAAGQHLQRAQRAQRDKERRVRLFKRTLGIGLRIVPRRLVARRLEVHSSGVRHRLP